MLVPGKRMAVLAGNNGNSSNAARVCTYSRRFSIVLAQSLRLRSDLFANCARAGVPR
jgi:hypothetical protein